MNEKDKAKDLVNKFYCQKDDLGLSFCVNYSNAKAAAKIAVEEIIKTFLDIDPRKDFWVEVLKEIDLL